MSLTLLGPERPDGALPELLVKHGVTGPVGLISAGWRYDEARDEPLRAAIPNEVKNLRLYDRFRNLERDAAELMSRYTAKQDVLRRIKDRYRMRVAAGLDSAYALLREFRSPTDKWFLQAVQQLRDTDELFLSEARPSDHPLVRREREGVRADLDGCAALCIAGGHIGVLRNRCVFLDVGPVLTHRPLYAWSAGAMLLTERVLLYHDHTAYGPGTAEFLDHGMGLLRETVLLPHAKERLNLTDTIHLSVLAHRLAPRKAVCLQNGAVYEDGRYTGKAGAAFTLGLDGSQHAASA